MSMTKPQPYSDRALEHAAQAQYHGWDLLPPETQHILLDELAEVADPMHDRSALGLDASAWIGDILDQILSKLAEREAWWADRAHDFLLREFEAMPDA
jgi:hypothetical protein